VIGQQEVYNYLKKHKGFASSKQISKSIGIGSGNVNNSLLKMFKAKEILKRRVKRDSYWIFEFKLK